MKESSFQLVGKPKLCTLHFETNNDFSLEGEVSLEIKHDIHVLKGIEELSNQALVVLKLGIFTNREFKEVPFKIEIEIEGHFKWDDAFNETPTNVDTMLKQNAPAILYSYTRPIITLITAESNLPPLVMPLMNFQN